MQETQIHQAASGGKKRGGRPVGSKQKLPPGHINVAGLGDLLGLEGEAIRRMEARGDPRIPPRSPIAGPRRAIWRIADVETRIQALADARTDQPHVIPNPNSPPGGRRPNPAAGSSGALDRKRVGRPRGTGKFSK